MKAGLVLVLVAAGSAPVISGVGMDWLHMDDVRSVLGGRSITDVAQDVARREFTPDVRLTLVNETEHVAPQIDGGGAAHPRAGYEYRAVGLRVENEGRLDVSIHTYHFTAFLDTGQKARAEVGLDTKFEVTQLPTGEACVGQVIFQVPPGSHIRRILWQGELSNSTLVLGSDAAGGAGDAAQAPPPVRVTLESVTESSHAQDAFGDDRAAEPGLVFRTARVEVTNEASRDVAIHTVQFTALDLAGNAFPARTDLSRQFEYAPLASGASAWGTVVFEMPADAGIARVTWHDG